MATSGEFTQPHHFYALHKKNVSSLFPCSRQARYNTKINNQNFNKLGYQTAKPLLVSIFLSSQPLCMARTRDSACTRRVLICMRKRNAVYRLTTAPPTPVRHYRTSRHAMQQRT
jgi:hypothetical protein